MINTCANDSIVLHCKNTTERERRMKIVKDGELHGTDRVAHCPDGGFVSERIIVAADNVGYSLTKTSIPAGREEVWHYKNHLESCYVISGDAVISDMDGVEHPLSTGDTYVLDCNDRHLFKSTTDVVLLCVFNPPLVGNELHDENRSYPAAQDVSPVYNVKSVHIDDVVANDYNPNSVAPPEMELLETSIWEDGYTQPVVTVYDPEAKNYVVVDGFHRYLTLRNSDRIRERENDRLPVVVLNKDVSDRMASTIRHNRARGTHNIELMSSIVSELVEMGKGDFWICKHIGMSKDELLRLKQITGVAALFENDDFSSSWEAEHDDTEEAG